MGASSSTGNPLQESLALFLRVYAVACADAGAPCGVQFQPGDDDDGKVTGELALGQMIPLGLHGVDKTSAS
jgi:hypothetical protein